MQRLKAKLRELTESDEHRFWAKVNMLDLSGCWTWTGAKTKGYGAFRLQEGTVQAHRIALQSQGFPVDPDLVIDHTCRNRACVNPAHLEQVTHA